MRALVAFGIVALVLVTGYVARYGLRPRKALVVTAERVIVTLALGVALLTPVLVILAEYGWFCPAAIGGAGLIAFGVLAGAHLRKTMRIAVRLRVVDAVLVAAAVAFLIAAFNGRDEPWGQGRDQQVYAEFAVLLADTGRATLTTRPEDAADAALLRDVDADRSVDRYIGMTRTFTGEALDARSYLPLGWPVWLALAYAVGGHVALHAANAPVFLLGALLLYPVLRRAVGRALAAGAAIALLALPSSLWIAGISLSEPLAMMMWLTTIALFSLGARRERWIPYVVFAASMIRLDLLLLAPALVAARFAEASLRPTARSARDTRHFAVSIVFALMASVAWYAVFGRHYLVDAGDYLAPVLLATATTVAMAWGSETWYARARSVFTRRSTVIVAAFMLTLAAYCIWWRPSALPFATIHNGTGLDGTRDFREDSLLNLGAYVSWPLLLLAIAGAAAAIVRFASPGWSLAQRAWVVSSLAYCALYVYAPLVSPDHPWAIRRFVPVVIPAVVGFAAFALGAVARRRLHAPAAASIAMIAAAASASVTAGTPLLTLKENQGAAALFDAIDRQMPADLVVATLPAANVGVVLSSTRRRRVVVVDIDRAPNRAAVARWIDAKASAGRPAWLLADDDVLPAGAHATIAGRWQYERRFIARSVRPPVRDVRTERLGISLVRADGLDRDLATAGFGGTPSWSIPDAGFQRPDVTPFGTLRMTDGSASLDVPAAMLGDATALEFTWFSWAPRGESRTVGVRVDDKLAWRARVPPGVSTVTVPLQPSARATTHVEIDSDAFDPRELDAADYRDRVGIGVIRIRALRP